MDIIKQTSKYIIIRIWLDIPASCPLDDYDMHTIREERDCANTINSFLSCYFDRGWAYIAKNEY